MFVLFLWGSVYLLKKILELGIFFLIFPRVSDPIRGSAPPARSLDQPDGCFWYQRHGAVKPLSVRLLLLQSPGSESRRLQRAKQALEPIQDQPFRWLTWSSSREKKCCNILNIQKHSLIEPSFFLVFLAPDDNPSDVQGGGTKPGNLVISWTVSYPRLLLWAVCE